MLYLFPCMTFCILNYLYFYNFLVKLQWNMVWSFVPVPSFPPPSLTSFLVPSLPSLIFLPYVVLLYLRLHFFPHTIYFSVKTFSVVDF